jgi:hypothetical protein
MTKKTYITPILNVLYFGMDKHLMAGSGNPQGIIVYDATQGTNIDTGTGIEQGVPGEEAKGFSGSLWGD